MKNKLLELAFLTFLFLRPVGNDVQIIIVSDTSWRLEWSTDLETWHFATSWKHTSDEWFVAKTIRDTGTLRDYKHVFYRAVETETPILPR